MTSRSVLRFALGAVVSMAAVLTANHLPSSAAWVGTSSSSGSSIALDTLASATSLAATCDTTSSLSWTATTDTYATGHRIYSSSSSGGPYSLLTTVTPRTTTTYLHSPSSGTTYYVARAYFGSWESVNSGQVGCGWVENRIGASTDDAEEDESNGSMYLDSSDLELIFELDREEQLVGMRFTGLAIPSGATITNAWIQFKTDQTTSGTTNLTIRAHDTDDASTFTAADDNISSRTTTTASVSWSPSAWNTVGEAGSAQRTPNLSSVIQEVVDRGGWSSGNDIAIIITGSGARYAESYDGDAAGAPLLRVAFSP